MNLTRRRFFQALAASALALGVPLAVGFPIESATAAIPTGNMIITPAMIAREALAQLEWNMVKLGLIKTGQATIITDIQHSGTIALSHKDLNR